MLNLHVKHCSAFSAEAQCKWLLAINFETTECRNHIFIHTPGTVTHVAALPRGCIGSNMVHCKIFMHMLKPKETIECLWTTCRASRVGGGGEKVVWAEVVVQVKKECKVFEKILDGAGRTFSVFGCEALLWTPSLVPPARPSTTAEQNVP